MTEAEARTFIALGAVLLAIATGLGAVASHGLEGVLEARALDSFETGVDYQFVHALGLIGIAVYAERHAEFRALRIAAFVLLAGIVLFCGGVYASSLGGPDWIAGLAPAGGIGLICGWLVVAFAMLHTLLLRRR